MHYVFDHELDTLGSASNNLSLFLSLFGLCGGAALALWITVATVDITNPKTHATFVAVFIVSALATVVFGFLAWFNWKGARDKVKSIKAESQGRRPEGNQ